jgi:methylated-DNA-protein-cysteine methyltransferase-like protein
MSDFLRAVRRIVRGIPRGMTLSYGEVALRAGKPRAARAVVAALHRLDDVPWWRVARHDGTLAPPVARQQASLLRQEGWKPRPKGRKRGARPRTRRDLRGGTRTPLR